ncbi:hypothetical protein FE257_000422 [Aspergillus nanangensis]|uniref:Ubiquitin-conjugating enzyme E2-binding protein n=1 Tax=Aspergillus nanangensis TaxID=2582783 RepID=A0AAD4CW03_ASPNN|nr:hypothetical protein FE257_000422 [Aspergillus nanangensis]
MMPLPLHSSSSPPPKLDLTLSNSRRAISVSLPSPLNHVCDTIQLPARVNHAARRTLSTQGEKPNPAQHTAEYAFRMQIDDSDDDPLLRRDEEALETFVPWTASEMGPTTRLRCRQCENPVLREEVRRSESDGQGQLPSSEGWVWKDLPSGNWAEMMDFWHCHKPDPEEEDQDHRDDKGVLSEEQSATVKGYGATNQVVAMEGNVLVDVATFLVVEGDCMGVKMADDDSSSLLCTQCNTLLGVSDPLSQGWRLFKTSLAASSSSKTTTSTPIWETHPIETIVAAQLLELIERESARRFVLHCDQPTGLLIWVFNPSLRYSHSSPSHRTTAQRAMKILFQDVPDVDALLHPTAGKPSALSLEELRLPPAVFAAVRDVLRRRMEMLPVSARGFREWDVGIMHRTMGLQNNPMNSPGEVITTMTSATAWSNDEDVPTWEHAEEVSAQQPGVDKSYAVISAHHTAKLSMVDSLPLDVATESGWISLPDEASEVLLLLAFYLTLRLLRWRGNWRRCRVVVIQG